MNVDVSHVPEIETKDLEILSGDRTLSTNFKERVHHILSRYAQNLGFSLYILIPSFEVHMLLYF